ncbi:MAG TPA: cation transporter [Kofleriaceae bacterium]|nr:cation transporter [Kofleriaceae bacterium]
MTRIRAARRGVVDLVRLACLIPFVAACAQEPAPRPAATAPTSTVTAPAKRARPRPLQLTRVTIKALGMTCEESCPIKVRTALAEIPAVYELGFDLPNESIFVSYDATLGAPKAVTRPMLDAIRSAGFDPWLAKDSWPDTATAEPL